MVPSHRFSKDCEIPKTLEGFDCKPRPSCKSSYLAHSTIMFTLVRWIRSARIPYYTAEIVVFISTVKCRISEGSPRLLFLERFRRPHHLLLIRTPSPGLLTFQNFLTKGKD